MNVFYVIAVLVGFGLSMALQNWSEYLRKKKAPWTDGTTPEIKKPNVLLEETLGILNCPYEKEDLEEKYFRYTFTFQGGNYVLGGEKDALRANITFPGVLTVKHKYLGLIRRICNNFNLHALTPYFMSYSYNEEEDSITAHISTSVLLESEITIFPQYFQACLTGCFSVREQFCSAFGRYKDDFDAASEADPDNEIMDEQRVVYLLRELELTQQTKLLSSVVREDEMLTLDAFFSRLSNALRLNYISLRVAGDDLQTITDVEEIEKFDFMGTIIEETEEGKLKFSDKEKVLILKYIDTAEVTSKVNLVAIILEADADTDAALYVRVTVCQSVPPLSRSNVLPFRETKNASFTILLARDKAGSTGRRAEFEFMWEDMKDKLKEGKHNDLTDEQSFLASINIPQINYDLYWGRKYFNEGRYYEASCYFKVAWNYLNEHADELDAPTKQMFMDVNFYLGMSYLEMNLLHSAYYYLDTVPLHQQMRYAEAYAHCMMRLHDFRTEGLLENFSKSLSQVRPDEEGYEDSGLKAFSRFLQRSKGWVLIEKGQLDDAERIFKGMLDDSGDADLALSALERIQNMREAMEDDDETASADGSDLPSQ